VLEPRVWNPRINLTSPLLIARLVGR